MDLVMVNTIVPLKFCYAKYLGKEVHQELVNLLSMAKPEKNAIIEGFDAIGPKTQNLLQSQAKIQLHKTYCSKNQCLQCAVGANLLGGNN